MEKPYILSVDETGRRYLIERKSDRSRTRHINQNGAGLWEIEIDGDSADGLPAFPNRDEAAHFAYMEGRFYCVTITSEQSERIQIRISPNFGQRYSCPRGYWFASFFHEENGNPAGVDCYSSSLEETKDLSLRRPMLGQSANIENTHVVWSEQSNNNHSMQMSG